MKWPWISREHHQEVVAGKDELITSLEVQIAVLAERLAEPIAVTVQMPENLVLLQPAVVRRKKDPATGLDARKESPEVDWASVDPDNPFVMAQLASQEFGRMLGPVELAEWTQRVRRQIKFAKDQNIRTPQIPEVGTLDTKQKEVPAHILTAIEAAERA